MTVHKTPIQWETPPATSLRQRQMEIAEALRSKPGCWALVSTHASAAAAAASASRIRTGKRKAFVPAFAFDAAPRLVDGQARVYVRYVGKDGAQ